MELPIFPLNGAVLFPGTSLPLNIFEDRYIEMVNYSLGKNRCIGMIQTDKNKKLYKIGCVGKIQSFNETTDGRYLISLQGINCFSFSNEIKSDFKFRVVKANMIKNNEDEENIFTENQKLDILNKYKEYVKIKNINLDLAEIEKIDLLQILKFIAMVSPFKNIEKQALLETFNSMEFYKKLQSIIELEIFGESDFKSVN